MTASTSPTPTRVDHSARLCGCCGHVATATRGCGCRINIEMEEDPIDGRETEPFRWCSWHRKCASEDVPLRHAALYFLDRAADALLASRLAERDAGDPALVAGVWLRLKWDAERCAAGLEALLSELEDSDD